MGREQIGATTCGPAAGELTGDLQDTQQVSWPGLSPTQKLPGSLLGLSFPRLLFTL